MFILSKASKLFDTYHKCGKYILGLFVCVRDLLREPDSLSTPSNLQWSYEALKLSSASRRQSCALGWSSPPVLNCASSIWSWPCASWTWSP